MVPCLLQPDVDGSDETTSGNVARSEREDLLARLFRDGLANAGLSWLLVAVLVGVFVDSVLDVDRLWIAFVAAAGVVVLLPPVASGDWRVMLPWEVLVVALLPILVRGLFGGEVGTFASYVSVAGLALLITVELHTFTGLTVTHWFAVTFVVLTTLASAAAWTIVRWNMDAVFGTGFLTTNEALMAEYVYVTLAGLTAGVLFDAYFRRRNQLLARIVRRVVRR